MCGVMLLLFGCGSEMLGVSLSKADLLFLRDANLGHPGTLSSGLAERLSPPLSLPIGVEYPLKVPAISGRLSREGGERYE